MKHRHKCSKCKRFFPCKQLKGDCMRYAAEGAYTTLSLCPKCYNKAVNAKPELPKDGSGYNKRWGKNNA